MVSRLLLLLLTLPVTIRVSYGQTSNLYPYRENNLWGYIDGQGKTVIPAIYRIANNHVEGLAAVRKNGRYGYIDNTGKVVIPFIYDYALEFNGGYALVYRSGKPYIIDKSGHELFEHGFTDIRNSGCPCRRIARTNTNHYGIIDLSGKILVDTIYSRIDTFMNGKAIILRSTSFGQRFTYKSAIVDTNGKTILPFGQFDDMTFLKDGFISARTRLHDTDYDYDDYILDSTYQRLYNLSLSNSYLDQKDLRAGLSPVSIDFDKRNSSYSGSNRYIGFIDKTGGVVFSNLAWYNATPFERNRAFVQFQSDDSLRNRWTLINAKGMQVQNQSYKSVLCKSEYGLKTEANAFTNGTAIVEISKGRWTAIDIDGNCMLDPLDIDSATKKNNVDVVARRNDIIYLRCDERTKDHDHIVTFGYWDIKHNIIVPPKYLWIEQGSIEDKLIRAITEDYRLVYLNYKGIVIWKEKNVSNTLRPLNVDYMVRQCFEVSGPESEYRAYGGWRSSENKERKASDVNKRIAQLRLIRRDETVKWRKGVLGYKLVLANKGKDTAYFAAQDGRLYMNIQAKDSNGTWRDIEYLPSSWCGNSYHWIALSPGRSWDFVAPLYEGEIKTKLRIKLEYSTEPAVRRSEQNGILYSEEYEGSINPAQFWRKEGHTPQGLMDPYND